MEPDRTVADLATLILADWQASGLIPPEELAYGDTAQRFAERAAVVAVAVHRSENLRG